MNDWSTPGETITKSWLGNNGWRWERTRDFQRGYGPEWKAGDPPTFAKRLRPSTGKRRGRPQNLALTIENIILRELAKRPPQIGKQSQHDEAEGIALVALRGEDDKARKQTMGRRPYHRRACERARGWLRRQTKQADAGSSNVQTDLVADPGT